MDAAQQIDGAYNIDAVAEYAPLVSFKNRSEYTSLTALSPDSPAWHLMDCDGKYYTPPENGLMISKVLANKLGVTIGDTVQITSSYFSPEPIDILVTNIIGESLGGGCYISIHALQKYFNITPMANAICLNCAPQDLDAIKASLSNTLNVSSVTDTSQALKSYKSMMNSMIQMVNVFAYFSILTGIILIYNISNISLRERQNEFGTLIILGSTSQEITEIISFEQLINFCCGILIGFPTSIVLKEIIKAAVISDSYTLNLHISVADYLYSFIICLIILFLSLFIIIRNLKKMDPTDVLKERE